MTESNTVTAPEPNTPVADDFARMLLDAAAVGDEIVIDAYAGAAERVIIEPEEEGGERQVVHVPTVEFDVARSTGDDAPITMIRNQGGGEHYLDRRATGARADEDIPVPEGEGVDAFFALLRDAARRGVSVRVVPHIGAKVAGPDGGKKVVPTASFYAHLLGADGDTVDLLRTASGNEFYHAQGAAGERGTPDEPKAY